MVWELFRVNRVDDCNLGFNQGSDPDRNLHYTHSDHGRIWPFRITDSPVKIHFHPTDYTDDGTSRPDCYWCILRLYPTKTQQYDPRAGPGPFGMTMKVGTTRNTITSVATIYSHMRRRCVICVSEAGLSSHVIMCPSLLPEPDPSAVACER